MIRFTADKARTMARLGSKSAETKSLAMIPELREQIVARIQAKADEGGMSLECNLSELGLNDSQRHILETELREVGRGKIDIPTAPPNRETREGTIPDETP